MIFVAIPGLFLASASAVAFFGRWWWPLDLMANFRPQLAIAALVLGLVLLVGRWRATAAIVVLAGLVDLALVVPLYVAPDRQEAITGDRIRVMSFNVKANNESYSAVIDYIRRLEPTVVFLHEGTRLWVEAVQQSNLGYEVVEGRSSELIFSTIALVPPGSEVQSFGFTETEPRALEVRIGEGERQVALLAIHALSPDTRRRAALRNAQLEYAGEWASRQASRAVVVGDFNATRWSYPFPEMLDIGELHDSERGFGLQPSFPATANPAIRIPIDHLLHSDGLFTVDRRLGPAMGSDHLPLVVDLAVTG